MTNKLRLLVTKECSRSCEGCCNKQWDLDGLLVEHEYKRYDEIMLTGGEPMLLGPGLLEIVREIRLASHAKIYVYTASYNWRDLEYVLASVDGVCITLHEQSDEREARLFALINQRLCSKRSMRLNVFDGICLVRPDAFQGWRVKTGISWIPNCPLPEHETFARHWNCKV